jgi:hypothetical protein
MWPEKIGCHSRIGSLDSDDIAYHAGPIARPKRERTVEVPDQELVSIHECM